MTHANGSPRWRAGCGDARARRRLRRRWEPLLLALLAGCAPAPMTSKGDPQGSEMRPTPSGFSEGTAQTSYSILDDLRARLTRAFGEGDARTIAMLFTDDGRLELPGFPVAEGRQKVLETLESLFARGEATLELAPETSRIIDAKLAEERGTFTLRSGTIGEGQRSFAGSYRLEGRLARGLELTELRLDTSQESFQ